MTETLHHWAQRIGAGDSPAYLMIAELIAEDVETGRLAARDRLPPLRELARLLNLNYTTVARGYAEASRRGLIDAKSGMGTFVRGRRRSLPLRAGTAAEMSMNLPPEPRQPELLARLGEGAALALREQDPYAWLRYQDFGGSPDDRAAGARWMRRMLPGIHADDILIASGIHSVLVGLLSQLVRPGEVLCVEALTYPGIKAIATQLGIRLHPLPFDEDGPCVLAFEDACKTVQPRAFYCNPTLLNPTTATIPSHRREALADVALRYSVPIIEDDAYAMLPRQMPEPLALLAPELTYYIAGFSKCVGAGVRVAYVKAPDGRRLQQLAGAMRATTVMASPVTNAIATRWINDGTAEAALNAIRAESNERQRLAAEHLQGHDYQAHPDGFHLWLPLPEPWHPGEFASQLRAQGVGVVSSAAFSTTFESPNAVRLCLGGPLDREQCDHALHLTAHLLDQHADIHAHHGAL
jgi:DNA-binding transcriptional MocR family regulator